VALKKPFTYALFLALGFAPGLEASAGGGLDPSYRDVLAAPERAVGRTVDWQVRLRTVQKQFYTYTMDADYLPDRGEEPCNDCRLAITFRGRPDETARPSRFKPRQVVTLRGVVLRLAPHPVVLAAIVDAK